MDAHKESVIISLADDDRGEVRRYDSIGAQNPTLKNTTYTSCEE